MDSNHGAGRHGGRVGTAKAPVCCCGGPRGYGGGCYGPLGEELLKRCRGPAGKARRDPGTDGVRTHAWRGGGRCQPPSRGDSRDLAAARTERCVAALAEELRRTRAGAERDRRRVRHHAVGMTVSMQRVLVSPRAALDRSGREYRSAEGSAEGRAQRGARRAASPPRHANRGALQHAENSHPNGMREVSGIQRRPDDPRARVDYAHTERATDCDPEPNDPRIAITHAAPWHAGTRKASEYVGLGFAPWPLCRRTGALPRALRPRHPRPRRNRTFRSISARPRSPASPVSTPSPYHLRPSTSTMRKCSRQDEHMIHSTQAR